MIPSRPLHLFEILQETFRIFGRTFFRALVFVLIFTLPAGALVFFGWNNFLDHAEHAIKASTPLSDSLLTHYRNSALEDIERQNPEGMSRLRGIFQSEDIPIVHDTAAATGAAPDYSYEKSDTTINIRLSHSYALSWITDLAVPLGLFFGLAFLASILSIGTGIGIIELSCRSFEERAVRLSLALRGLFRRHFWVVSGYIILVLAVGWFVPTFLRTTVFGTNSPASVLFSLIVFVGQVYLSIRLSMTVPAIVSEEIGIFAGIQRSWSLTGSNWWRIVGIWIVFGIIVVGISSIILVFLSFFGIQDLFGLIKYLIVSPTITVDRTIHALRDLFQFGLEIYAIPVVLASMLVPVFTTVLYYDLRTRLDGPLSYDEPSHVTIS